MAIFRSTAAAAILICSVTGMAAQETGTQPPQAPSVAPSASDGVPAAPASPGASTSGAAQPADADTLAECFVTHSGAQEADAMKRIMVAALSDDTPGLKTSLSDFSGLLLKLALSSCGVGLSQLQDPAYGALFQKASSKYGSVLGARLMQDAFAKLN